MWVRVPVQEKERQRRQVNQKRKKTHVRRQARRLQQPLGVLQRRGLARAPSAGDAQQAHGHSAVAYRRHRLSGGRHLPVLLAPAAHDAHAAVGVVRDDLGACGGWVGEGACEESVGACLRGRAGAHSIRKARTVQQS